RATGGPGRQCASDRAAPDATRDAASPDTGRKGRSRLRAAIIRRTSALRWARRTGVPMSRSSTPPAAARARAFALARPRAFAVSCASMMLAGLHPACASAQAMNPVVVTATRTEVPIEAALADVTVIDAAAI